MRLWLLYSVSLYAGIIAGVGIPEQFKLEGHLPLVLEVAGSRVANATGMRARVKARCILLTVAGKYCMLCQ